MRWRDDAPAGGFQAPPARYVFASTDALRAGAVDRLNEKQSGLRKQQRRPCGRRLPNP
jgi:hypothetical protein